MSIRTIVEINHDTLNDLTDAEVMRRLSRFLSGGNAGEISADGPRPQFGNIRVLAQRHHSEAITVKVG